MPDELLGLIEGMALRRPPPHAAEVHRAAAKIAAEQGRKTPSYTVVREVIAGQDRGMLALAHHDGSVYRDAYELVLRQVEARRTRKTLDSRLFREQPASPDAAGAATIRPYLCTDRLPTGPRSCCASASLPEAAPGRRAPVGTRILSLKINSLDSSRYPVRTFGNRAI